MPKTKLSFEVDELFTIKAAADLLGIHRTSLYRWVRHKKVIAVKVGGSLLIPVTEMERLKRQGGIHNDSRTSH